MDLNQIATDLIERQERRTDSLSPLVRSAARSHYRTAITELLRVLQEATVTDELRQQTAPLAVQPSHSAVTAPIKELP